MKSRLESQEKMARFEAMVMPHLDAAYNLARWLTHNEHDAQDVVQDACLRAFKFFDGFRGDNSRSWLLSIVRNTCYTWFEKNRRPEVISVFDEEIHTVENDSANTETMVLQNADQELVRQALTDLPVEFREVMVLRDLEGMSYKEISQIAEIPLGTVMSRLARARNILQQNLTRRLQPGGPK